MLGWMIFYELEDGAGDDEKYKIGDYVIYDIIASSANIASWSACYESFDIADDKVLCPILFRQASFGSDMGLASIRAGTLGVADEQSQVVFVPPNHEIDIIYKAADRFGIIDEGKSGSVGSSQHVQPFNGPRFSGHDISSWNRTGAAITMGSEVKQIIHVGDVEDLNTLPEDIDETIDPAASKSRRTPIGARTVGG